MAQLDVLDTAGSQFRVGYDAAHYAELSVSSGGALTITPTGGDTSVTGDLRAPTGRAEVGMAGAAFSGTNSQLQAGTAGVNTTVNALALVNTNQSITTTGEGVVMDFQTVRAGAARHLLARIASGRDGVYDTSTTRSGNLQFVTCQAGAGVEVMRMDGTGRVLVGTTVATGAVQGEVVLANAKALRSVVAAGTSTVALVFLDASNRLSLNANSAALAITNPSTATTVGAAGAAGALPSAPTGYLVVSIAGTNRKIPYYAS